MASTANSCKIDVTTHTRDNQIIATDFIVKVTNEKGEVRTITKSLDDDTYKELVTASKKPALPWEKFVKVLLAFMVGKTDNEIREAFEILDADNSKSIDIKELGTFLPALVPDLTDAKLMEHIKKIDKNTDQKMTLAEFSQLIKRGIGMDIIIGEP